MKTLSLNSLLPIALLAVLTPVMPLPAASPTPDAEGFVPMFNGKDLAGWVPCNVAADTFRWENGMVVTTGIPVGFMRTDKVYENFIIELEWRHLKEAGNSGLFIWGEGLPAPGVPYARGIEVQILDLGYEKNKGANEWFTSHGDIFPIWGATMTPTGRVATNGKRSFPTENRTKPSPEWNHYRVECQDGVIRLSVNGKEVTVGKDCFPRKGYICLESEGSEAHFRNVRIKELPSSGATVGQTARLYEGFEQLFDGKTLAGWNATAEAAPFWTAQGAIFKGKADPAGNGQDLWTEKSYKDFILCVDWRQPNKPQKKALAVILPSGEDAVDAQGQPKTEERLHAGDSGIFLRGDKKAQVNITSKSIGSGEIYGYRTDLTQPAAVRAACVPKSVADQKAGAWNRFFITVKGDRVTVELNEQIVIDQAQLPGLAGEGPIGLQHHGDGIEFGNIFLKPL
jgi:hypothetical protein